MTHDPADLKALAAVLRDAERVIMLTGLALGVVEDRELTGAAGQWASRASLEAFLTEPAAFWEFYYPAALRIAARTPGPGHAAIARLQKAGVIHGLVTQAVDRLHLKAGSPDLVEVHGHVMTTRCERCGEVYGLPEVGALIEAADDGVPRCTNTSCRYPLRPSTSLWGEPLIEDAVTLGLGACRPGRRVHRRRLQPSHDPDVAASLGAADPKGAVGGDHPRAHPVRPLRAAGGAYLERGPAGRGRR